MSTNPALDRIKSRGQIAGDLGASTEEEPIMEATTPVPDEWVEEVVKEDGASSVAALQGPLQGDESKGGALSSPSRKFRKKKKETYADPEDKKLPIGDTSHLAQAITALSDGGFRGHKVQFKKGTKAGAVKKISSQIDSSSLSADKKQHLHDRLNKSKGYITPKSPSFWNKGKTGIAVFKAADGQRLAFLITSNSYEDREAETVTTAALKEYVEASWGRVEDQCVTKNTFHLWHGGEPIGDIVWCDMEGPFLIEVAKERPNKRINLARDDQEEVYGTVKEVWDYIESHPELDSVSQGFHFYKNRKDAKTKTYDRIFKFESSVLPRKWASNSLTMTEVFNVPPRDELLEKITGAKGTASKAKDLRRGIKGVVKTLSELGIQHKSIDGDDEDVDTTTKGLVEDMRKEITTFLNDMTEEADVDEMVPQILDIIMGCISSSDGDQSPDADYKDDGYQYDDTDPSVQPMAKQIKLMDGLISTQEGLLQEITSIGKSVKGLDVLPDQFGNIVRRLEKVEKQLRLRPKDAANDPGTQFEDEDIFDAVKEQLARVDPFFGVHVASEPMGGSVNND